RHLEGETAQGEIEMGGQADRIGPAAVEREERLPLGLGRCGMPRFVRPFDPRQFAGFQFLARDGREEPNGRAGLRDRGEGAKAEQAGEKPGAAKHEAGSLPRTGRGATPGRASPLNRGREGPSAGYCAGEYLWPNTPASPFCQTNTELPSAA